MKAKFSKRVKYIPEFQGNHQLPDDEQIVTWVKPLKLNDLLILMDQLQGLNLEGEGDQSGFKDLIESCGSLLPQYCEIQNLTDSDGESVSAVEVTEYPYFLELASEILSHMATVSMPSEEEIKNLNAQPGIPAHPQQ